MSEEEKPKVAANGKILAVHYGHSANCSSIGSFIDFLFLSSAIGGAALTSLEIYLNTQNSDPGSQDVNSQQGQLNAIESQKVWNEDSQPNK